MNANALRPYFLVALILVSSVLAFFIFRPFIVTLVLALVFAVVLQPLYRTILRGVSGSPGLAAFVTMLFSVVCIVIPLAFITMQIAGEAQNLYSSITDNGSGETYLNTLIKSVYVEQYVRGGLEWLVQNLGGAFGGIARLLLSLFIFLIALYYFLRDGTKIKQIIIDISPLRDTDDSAVLTRLEQSINSVIRGSLTIALIQGVLTSIGFALFGVPNFILWGVVASLSALIPGIGTSLVLVPGIAYLFIIGAMTPAIGLLAWSVIAVGLIDNFLGPKLVGKSMNIHPLIVLLSVFGGLAFFGPAGLFLGPLCTSLLFALVSIHPPRVSNQ